MLATPAFVHLYCSRSTQDNCHFNTKFKYLEVLSMILVEWMTRVGHTKFSRTSTAVVHVYTKLKHLPAVFLEKLRQPIGVYCTIVNYLVMKVYFNIFSKIPHFCVCNFFTGTPFRKYTEGKSRDACAPGAGILKYQLKTKIYVCSNRIF